MPGRATRNAAYPLNRTAYRRRNVIERMFGKLKNQKRIATRYDRLAVNFLKGAHKTGSTPGQTPAAKLYKRPFLEILTVSGQLSRCKRWGEPEGRGGI